MKIVVLGMCCRVSNTLKALNMKAETSLFEWMRSEKFSDIVKITSKVVRGEPVSITKRAGFRDDFLGDTDIRTIHFLGNLDSIFERRSQRLLDYIKNDQSPVLFIREDNSNVTERDLSEFIDCILSVNPDCNFKFLLFSEKADFIPIKLDHVFHYKLPRDKVEYEAILRAIL